MCLSYTPTPRRAKPIPIKSDLAVHPAARLQWKERESGVGGRVLGGRNISEILEVVSQLWL